MDLGWRSLRQRERSKPQRSPVAKFSAPAFRAVLTVEFRRELMTRKCVSEQQRRFVICASRKYHLHSLACILNFASIEFVKEKNYGAHLGILQTTHRSQRNS